MARTSDTHESYLRSVRWSVYDAIAAILLAVLFLSSVEALWGALRSPLSFDDSYMFARYAHQLRVGHGFSWNADGVHTFGPTSLLWSAVVFLGSFLPGGIWPKLVLLSFGFSIAAMVAMAWAVAVNLPPPQSFGRTLGVRVWRVLPWVALPLCTSTVLRGNQSTGMETMLALTLCALFTGAAIAWRRDHADAWLPGALGILLYLSRPEAALVALALPLLLWLGLPQPRPLLRSLGTVLGLTLAGIVLQLGICLLYFHTAVPLSVYMKGHHAYLGYRGVWHPELLLAAFLLALWPYLAVALLFARGNGLRLLLCCIAPLCAICIYLQTVTQIMGFHGRYYVPYLPLVVIPSLLLLADRFHARDTVTGTHRVGAFRLRATIAVLMLVALGALSSEAVAARLRKIENHAREDYDAPVLTIAATKPLPELPWDVATRRITDLLVRPLPTGTVVAATEVGYLGALAPQVDLIDLAGLNDTEIALHGFHMDGLLARHPDVIWLPNTDYTWQRGEMFADTRFLQQYDVYAGAANYGVALRRDSPHQDAIEAAFQNFWQNTYPGYNAADYRVQAATWSGLHHTVRGE